MTSYEAVRLKVRRSYAKATASLRRRSLVSPDFTIISNNCWAGLVYQSYGIPYKTPTVGLYFMAEDYIKFVSALHDYLEMSLEFIAPSNSKYNELLKLDRMTRRHPIGLLGDVEIMFLHYASEVEAKEKWQRRTRKINWDRTLVKFNDQNSCVDEHIARFDSLDIGPRVCLTAKEHAGLASVINIPSAEGQAFVQTSQEPFGRSRHLDVTSLLNRI